MQQTSRLYRAFTLLAALQFLALTPAWANAMQDDKLNTAPVLTEVWQTSGLRVPESVLVHQQQNDRYLFVSEIEGQANSADGQGGIAILNLDGSIRQQNWLRGLNAPKGMAVFEGKLYVADITELVIIDIARAEVISKIPAPDAVFLNDVTIDQQGVVTISDTRKNRLYRYQNHTLSIWLEDIDAANGVKAIADTLYVAANDRLLKIDHQKNITLVAQGFAERADGLVQVAEGHFIVSCWAGLIYYVNDKGHIVELLDSRETKLNTADLGWDAESNTLYVPTFLGNSVRAFQLTRP
ncbi:SMP-30/gluconolactonase/LRE family protein [Alishewanella tabrizica]|uniref:ATP/GTP-binding protein n=1 Tax=Alishewanella tabrizica TaxID=671278 RepID=A0ABQ2WIN3_9ALTE|nr:GTP-binding protein [Alishewanella tabrizica]GGW55398.1 ATP/GTP-binding protein [Alishewanella tabrizica]